MLPEPLGTPPKTVSSDEVSSPTCGEFGEAQSGQQALTGQVERNCGKTACKPDGLDLTREVGLGGHAGVPEMQCWSACAKLVNFERMSQENTRSAQFRREFCFHSGGDHRSEALTLCKSVNKCYSLSVLNTRDGCNSPAL